MFPGIVDRMHNELIALSPSGMKVYFAYLNYLSLA